MKRLYRIECKEDRRGAYSSNAAYYANIDTNIDTNLERTHPGPHQDYGLRDIWRRMDSKQQLDMYFGFGSIEQYRNWFHCAKGRKAIREEHQLAVYECPEGSYTVSYFQMIADSTRWIHIGDLLTTCRKDTL